MTLAEQTSNNVPAALILPPAISSAFLFVRLYAITSKPCFAKFSAMPFPMVPIPIKPTVAIEKQKECFFIKLLETPRSRDELVRESKLDIGNASAILSLLEIKGLIAEELGEVRKTF